MKSSYSELFYKLNGRRLIVCKTLVKVGSMEKEKM